MQLTGCWLRALAVTAAVTCAGAARPALAQSGLAGSPPGVVGAAGDTPPAVADPVVADVEGHQVHLSELGDEIQSLPGGRVNAFETMYPLALRRLIERTVLIIRATQAGLPDDPAVKRHMREAEDRVLEDAYLQHATAARVTEQMLLARYDTEFSGKPGPEEVHGRAILVPTEAAAQAIIAKLAAGADFGALARAQSQDPTAGSGGDLGFVERAQVNPILGAVLFSLRAGEVTAYPVPTPSGWFVLQVVARRQAPTPGFTAVRGRLMAECQRDQVAAVMRAALAGIDVRTYDMNGHVMAAPSAQSGDN